MHGTDPRQRFLHRVDDEVSVVEPGTLIGAFPDLDEMTEDCPRGCTHGEDEPECGLDEAVTAGEADPERVESFRRLLAARSEPVY